MKCPECNLYFNGEGFVGVGQHSVRSANQCPRCQRKTNHTGRDTPADKADRLYHGGEFHKGEW